MADDNIELTTATKRIADLEKELADFKKDAKSKADTATKRIADAEEALKKANAEDASPTGIVIGQLKGVVANLSSDQIGELCGFARDLEAGKPLVPSVGIEDFLSGVPLKAPMIKVRGEDQLSKDRRYATRFQPDGFVHVEELNFRNSSGYDDNWRRNAMSALERGTNLDFGKRDQGGLPVFDKLPPFDQMNRVIVLLAVLPAAEAEPEDEE